MVSLEGLESYKNYGLYVSGHQDQSKGWNLLIRRIKILFLNFRNLSKTPK
jgi:hypothetical protein